MKKLLCLLVSLFLSLTIFSINPVIAETNENDENHQEVLVEVPEEEIEENIIENNEEETEIIEEEIIEEENEDSESEVIENEETESEETIAEDEEDVEEQENIDELEEENVSGEEASEEELVEGEQLEGEQVEEVPQEEIEEELREEPVLGDFFALESASPFNPNDYVEIDLNGNFTYDNDKYVAIYNGSEQHPELVAKTDEGYTMTLNSINYVTSPSTTEDPIKAINPGQYKLGITYNYSYSNGDDPINNETARWNKGNTIVFEIKKRELVPSYTQSIGYAAKEIHPTVYAYVSGTGSSITLVEGEDYTIENVKNIFGPCESIYIGEYTADIVWSDDFKACNELINPAFGERYQISYEITKREVEFSRFVIDGESQIITGQFLDKTVDFIWKNVDGQVCLEYNGYSPFLFRKKGGEPCLPDAVFKYLDENDEYQEIENVSILDYDYDPLCKLEYVKFFVGDYYADIDFILSSPLYITKPATFKIVPKPVSVEWTKTIIDVSDRNKRPASNIVGLADIDKYGIVYKNGKFVIEEVDKLSLSYAYYDANDLSFERPYISNPTEVGEYIAKPRYVIYANGNVNPNYVITGPNTAYQIVDMSSIQKIVLDNGASITIATLDKTTNAGLGVRMQAPTVEEALGLISYLQNSSNPNEQALGDLLNSNIENGKNINIYLVSKDVNNPERLNLPSDKALENCVLFDLELFASISGDTMTYPITDTGSYNVKVNVEFDQNSADTIGNNENKEWFVARYHNNSSNNDSIIKIEPIIDGSGEDTTYTFVLTTNKFSDFVVYTLDKYVPKPSEDEEETPSTREVPNTGN